MERLKGKDICALCENWTNGAQFVGQDRLYCFTTTGYHPKVPAGLRISSQAQWNRLLKRKDLTDDVGIAERIRRKQENVKSKRVAEHRTAFRVSVTKMLKRALQQGR